MKFGKEILAITISKWLLINDVKKVQSVSKTPLK